MIAADLHMHSYFSDGLLPPETVAELAKAAGAQAVALTDHDTVAGVERMRAACGKSGLVNLTGIEISTHAGCEVHILGYNLDTANAGLAAFLADMAAAKEKRIRAMLDKLAAHGMPLSFEQVKAFAVSSLSRGHVARAMVAAGYAADVGECFEKWLFEGGPCFVSNTQAAPETAIEIIHAAGGVAVLAHPMRMKCPDAQKFALIERLRKAGLDGIEAGYKNMPTEVTAPYSQAARRHGLFITNGGDFHGRNSRIVPRPLESAAVKALGLAEK